MRRRSFLQLLGAGAAAWLQSGCATFQPKNLQRVKNKPRIVIIGGGFAGATAAKYLSMWSKSGIDVTLLEPRKQYVSGPVSNLVISGVRNISEITHSYEALSDGYGVKRIHEKATAIDSIKKNVRLASGQKIAYDRLIVSPGIDFMWELLPGLESPSLQQQVLHGWIPGQQTLQLQAQLQRMQNGQTFVIAIPPAPYRCPPGPYERACQVAFYLQQHNIKAKVLVLDANEDVISKGALFKAVWQERYRDLIEYHPRFTIASVDLARNTLVSEFGDRIKADVLNLIPPQRAGNIAQQSGLANINQRWCEVDFLSYQSSHSEYIHVLGDAIQAAQLMPKSGHMANQQAKVCAAAVIDLFEERQPNSGPVINNTCYSYISDHEAMHIASVHRYDPQQKTMLHVAGGLSAQPSALEATYAWAWAKNLSCDVLGIGVGDHR